MDFQYLLEIFNKFIGLVNVEPGSLNVVDDVMMSAFTNFQFKTI